jgi:hypothetical protein
MDTLKLSMKVVQVVGLISLLLHLVKVELFVFIIMSISCVEILVDAVIRL